MQNIRPNQLKTCITLECEDFNNVINQIYPGATVDYSLDGVTIEYPNDEDVSNDELHSKLAEYFDVNEVTSFHIDDCDTLLVWIVYKD